MKNKDVLRSQGVVVPGPSRFRKLIRETLAALGGETPKRETQDALVDAIIDEDEATRLILSGEHMICVPTRIFHGSEFYALAGKKAQALAGLFPATEVEFHIGLRNPATFIPSVFDRTSNISYENFMNEINPLDIRWSDVLKRIKAAVPNATLTVWANEDTPLIWAELMRELAGVDPMVELSGTDDLLAEIMTRSGFKRFQSYLESHPPRNEIQKRRVIAAFLGKFAMVEKMEQELDIEGWTDDYVDQLTDLYEEDLDEVQRMHGVNFIAP
ncbi:hypothetical protein ACFFUT_09085 [Pseudohalocynthiibacter aestuariivivens]|uniref:Uncharacterized protein n=1 Tax=Pseudohalocynthiibacter aestuariivivens TaxID=1591409 RepID=A0ABV5JGN2_9RHOB|nr:MULTISPECIES: hypothetical protein [Pseudohalocynthiibacter]